MATEKKQAAESTRYFIPAAAIEVTTEIKRSRFIARIAHCANAAEAMQMVAQAEKSYPDARHHCWAYIACPPHSASAVRFNDAGEPSGTAGRPILNALHYSHYGEIICVVSRYFGGIKLGAGGLVRAYSNSTQAALEQLQLKEIVALSSIKIRFPYPFESSVRHYLESIDAIIHQVNYQQQVNFCLDIEQTQLPEMLQHIRNLCKGEVLLVE